MRIQELALSTQPGLLGAVVDDLRTVHQQLFLTWTLDNISQMTDVVDFLTDFDLPMVTKKANVEFMLPQAVLPIFSRWCQERFEDQQLCESLQQVKSKHRLIWQAGRFSFDVTDQPLIYAILNITPDSFYDGGKYYQQSKWQQRVAQLLGAGADVVEVGGQTTRPGGFQEITPEEEIQRVVPAVEYLHQHYPQVAIAVDTYKLPVMRAVLAAGADIINDVQGFDTLDKRHLLATSTAGLVTMHSSRKHEYHHLTISMKDFFSKNLHQLMDAEIDKERIVIDQGIGYAKVADGYQDFAMMRNIDQLNQFQRPILVGISRKGFAKRLLGLAKKDRLPATLVAETYMYLHGGRILRVHDVRETKQLVEVVNAINQGYWNRSLKQEGHHGETNQHDE